ncbi:hypothetical protein EI427_25520 [Flammeovirga pectinis]|uniref:Transglutaminase-like domain-containing protein n=1 Tax=Flammeovirga pectinis TaxID=2494373 RepID=A0A3S9PBG8_9BACT|nr:transglutaminase domain-containing protein [Flammeovirga pectinis]AZQ65575.1 hypothetical protein EI427_25520 [Flammeovirga pectinis]
MKQIIYFFIILLAIKSSTVTAQDIQGKEYAKYASSKITVSFEQLSRYLTENEHTDYAKALNIYTWVVHNLTVDLKAYNITKPKYYSVNQILKRKKGTSEDFAMVFDSLCHAANIRSKKVEGYVFSDNSVINTVIFKPNHTWNAIKLDERWFLVDSQWGAGKVTSDQDKTAKNDINDKVFRSKVTYNYFCISPDEFIKTHLPANPTWQLLDNTITLKEFIQGIVPLENSVVYSSENLDNFDSLAAEDFIYADAKMALEFNQKNHKQLSKASLLKGGTLIVPHIDNKEAVTNYFKKKQIYYHEAASSAASYNSDVSFYSRIEKDALVLWERHNFSVPLSKREKYISRNLLTKDAISDRKNSIKNEQSNYKKFSEKIKERYYPSLSKPRRKSEYDRLYFKITHQQIHEIDSVVEFYNEQLTILKKDRNEYYLKLIDQNNYINQLNKSQTEYLEQLYTLVQSNVSLKVLEHQSEQISNVEKSIVLLKKKNRVLEMSVDDNETKISSYISLLKRKYVEKQGLLRGLYIKSNGETKYKMDFDLVNASLKALFFSQSLDKKYFCDVKQEFFKYSEEQNQELITQTEMIKDLSKIIVVFHTIKSKEIDRLADREKMYCESIIKQTYEQLSKLKDERKNFSLM